MGLLSILQFLKDGNSQEIFPSTWVILQLYSSLYVTFVKEKMFLNRNSYNPTEELYIEN